MMDHDKRGNVTDKYEADLDHGPNHELGHERGHIYAAIRGQAPLGLPATREETTEKACDNPPRSAPSASGISQSSSPQVSNSEKAATTSLLPESMQVILEYQDKAMPPPADAEVIVRGEDMSPIPEQLGLPLDGRSGHDPAYDNRYWFQHGEDEFLLGTSSRWMR